MLDIGKLIPRDAPMICDFCFSSMLDIGKLIQVVQSFRSLSGFSSMLDIGKLILQMIISSIIA